MTFCVAPPDARATSLTLVTAFCLKPRSITSKHWPGSCKRIRRPTPCRRKAAELGENRSSDRNTIDLDEKRDPAPRPWQPPSGGGNPGIFAAGHRRPPASRACRGGGRAPLSVHRLITTDSLDILAARSAGSRIVPPRPRRYAQLEAIRRRCGARHEPGRSNPCCRPLPRSAELAHQCRSLSRCAGKGRAALLRGFR